MYGERRGEKLNLEEEDVEWNDRLQYQGKQVNDFTMDCHMSNIKGQMSNVIE